MEEAGSSEILVPSYWITWHHSSECHSLYALYCEKLRQDSEGVFDNHGTVHQEFIPKKHTEQTLLDRHCVAYSPNIPILSVFPL
jgi:hypothetical protein